MATVAQRQSPLLQSIYPLAQFVLPGMYTDGLWLELIRADDRAAHGTVMKHYNEMHGKTSPPNHSSFKKKLILKKKARPNNLFSWLIPFPKLSVLYSIFMLQLQTKKYLDGKTVKK